jgi:hypothetical protein
MPTNSASMLSATSTANHPSRSYLKRRKSEEYNQRVDAQKPDAQGISEIFQLSGDRQVRDPRQKSLHDRIIRFLFDHLVHRVVKK